MSYTIEVEPVKNPLHKQCECGHDCKQEVQAFIIIRCCKEHAKAVKIKIQEIAEEEEGLAEKW
jgi:hypothetical protein